LLSRESKGPGAIMLEDYLEGLFVELEVGVPFENLAGAPL
jgi:hypothetical protein